MTDNAQLSRCGAAPPAWKPETRPLRETSSRSKAKPRAGLNLPRSRGSGDAIEVRLADCFKTESLGSLKTRIHGLSKHRKTQEEK